MKLGDSKRFTASFSECNSRAGGRLKDVSRGSREMGVCVRDGVGDGAEGILQIYGSESFGAACISVE